MAIPAKSIVRRAIDLIQDQTSIRWPVDEVVRWMNDGQREVMLYRPDAFNKSATVACVAGTKQTLPADGVKLIDVQRNNTSSSKRAVRLCEREILDSQRPGWHSLAGRDEIVHFMYDPREPKAFWVYPPATGNARLDINYSANPSDLAEPADGDWSSVVGDLSVPDVFANSLLDYVLYRVYSKDADYAGNAGRAQAAYTAFAAALGIEVRGTVAVGPTSRGNPNSRSASAASAAVQQTAVG